MPGQQPFPSDVESFISHCIDSVEQVEVLLLLRAAPERRWSPEELSKHFRSSVHSVGLRLQQLLANGLVQSEPDGFFYRSSPEHDHLVDRLAETYDERRTAVIERIFSRKKDAMQSFADAFRIRNEEDENDG